MSSDQGRLKPPESIGRAQGAKLPRNSSRESLTTHPLLSSAQSDLSTEHTLNPGSPSTSPQPNYVPYVPRQQRPLPTSPPIAAKSAVASTPVSRQTSASPNAGSSNGTPLTSAATSKLQMQNLKAAAQRIGLNGHSFGWAMLEKLVNDADLDKVWSALTVGKATLLLPAEDSYVGEKITHEMIEDHVIFLDLASRASTPVVTLSGLRGTLKESVLTFQSFLSPSSNAFQSLHSPGQRTSALSNLPPLHTLRPQCVYPKFIVYPNVAMLPIPPKKPFLPPRPPAQPLGSTTGPAASRLSSFASLFGSRTSTPAPTPSSQPTISHNDTDKAIDISAVVIDTKIFTNTVARLIYKEIRKEVQDAMKEVGAPSWVFDRVFSFMTPFLPVVKSKKSGIYSIQDDPNITESASALSETFQYFYDELEEEIRHGKSSSCRSEELTPSTSDTNEKEKKVNEEKLHEIMESVEKVLCTMLSDRLMRPDTSDDVQHDEALASRIAALNLLDLTPEHLGVDVGSSDRALSQLISKCGQALCRLSRSDCQSPAEKGAALVVAHHVLVDGLSKLPPIKLKPEQEITAPKQSPRTPNSDTLSSVDDATRRGSRPGTPSIHQLTLEQELRPISPKVSYREELNEENEKAPAPIKHASQDSATTQETTTVSGDILLPLIIYSVVKCNPSHLVSHLLFVQRFRNRTVGGEESYSLVNLMAVVEFLEHVDLEALGLADNDRVLSTEDLTPIPIGPEGAGVSQSASARLRGRVVQGADAIAGSAKMLSGVVDTSIGALKGLLLSHPDATPAEVAASWNPVRPGIGLLRRASGFSIASVAASLPGSHKDRGTAPLHSEQGQQLKDVSSRPNSILEDGSGEEESDYEDEEEEEEEDGEEEEYAEPLDVRSDSRSVRSFSSMMSSASRQRKKGRKNNKERKSLADRLANMSGLAKAGGAASLDSPVKGSPASSRRVSAVIEPSTSGQTVVAAGIRKVAPAKKRFLEGSAYDLRLSEVNELLAEYRRVVGALTDLEGFDGPPQ